MVPFRPAWNSSLQVDSSASCRFFAVVNSTADGNTDHGQLETCGHPPSAHGKHLAVLNLISCSRAMVLKPVLLQRTQISHVFGQMKNPKIVFLTNRIQFPLDA